MVMNIGKLCHRITIQKSTPARDSFGAEIEDWTDFAAVWANIEPINGREYFSAKQVNAEITTKIVIRYKEDITSQMRVLFADKIYEIISVICPEEKHTELLLMCKEII
jgi:SPP1 family predicted phage head-tail adaptor